MKLTEKLSIVPLWLAAMAWHMWRALSMRPAFAHLGDTRLGMWSFLGIYVAGSLLRWGVVADPVMPSAEVASYTILHCVLLMVLFERAGRSSSLVFVAFAISAGMDFLACGLYLVGLTPSVYFGSFLGGLCNLIEPGLTLWAYKRFQLEPEEIRARGYRPGGKASVMPA